MTWQRTIGVAVPRTGSTGAIGESVKSGIELAAADLREAQPDHHDDVLSVRIEDTGGDPSEAARVASTLIDEGVPAVIGPISSDVALRVREVAERREVPLIPTVGGNPELTKPGTRYTFRFAGSNRQNARGTLEFFQNEGASRIAVVGADFSYPRAVVRNLEKFAPAFDLTVGPVRHTPLGTTDFTSLLDDVDPDAVDGLFLPYPGENATTLLRQLQDGGLFDRCVVLGDYSFGSTPYWQRLDRSMAGTHNWGIDTVSHRWRRLSERLGEPAGVYHVLGYDIARLAGQALVTASEPTPEAVRDRIADRTYDSIAGWETEFDDAGVNRGYRLSVNRWIELDDHLRNLPVFRSAPTRDDS